MAISINPDLPPTPQSSKVASERARTRSTDKGAESSATSGVSRPAAFPDQINVSPQAQQRTGAPVGDGPADAAIGDAPGRGSGISDPDVAAERAALTSALIVGQPGTAAKAHASLSSQAVLQLLAA